MMDVKIIKTDAEHEAALAHLYTLMDAEPETPEYDELELLTLLVEKYEDEHYPIGLPDPVEAIKFRMDQQGLTRADMIPYLGSQSKVSEVLNRKRGLSLAMIRALHEGLGIPAEVLLGEPGKRLEECKYDFRDYPFDEMYQRGYFPTFFGNLPQAKERAEELLTGFFEALEKLQPQPVLCWKSEKRVDMKTVLAWQARVLNMALLEELPSFSRQSFTADFISEVVKLSYFSKGPELAKELLNKKGIHFIVLSHLPGTDLDGACFNTLQGAPVIGMTLRYDRLDNFWFTLTHELAHIHLHLDGSKKVFLDDTEYNESKTTGAMEEEMVKFVRDRMIPPEEWRRAAPGLLASTKAADLRGFADQIGVSPAIIAGRVRWENSDYRQHSRLVGNRKVREQFAEYA